MECIKKLKLGFVKSIRAFFSWSAGNVHGKRIHSMIGHCLGNNLWFQKHSVVVVQYVPPCVSDHSPLITKVYTQESDRGKTFRFLNHITDHENFLKIVKEE